MKSAAAVLLLAALLSVGCTINRFEVNMSRVYTVTDSHVHDIEMLVEKGDDQTSIPNLNAQAVDTKQLADMLNNLLELAAKVGIKLIAP